MLGDLFALLLIWDLSEKPPERFQELRRSIADESWARYAGRAGLRQKVWFSDEGTRRWGAFYLWETQAALEEEVRTMGRVQARTGVAPVVSRFKVEAIQEGRHAGTELLAAGLARGSLRDRGAPPDGA